MTRDAPPREANFGGIFYGVRPFSVATAWPDGPALLLAQRRRLGDLLAALPTSAWSAPTRCHLWDVADVVSHLTDTNRWACDLLRQATDPTSGATIAGPEWDNRVTPHAFVLRARGRKPDELLDDLEAGSEKAAAELAAAAADPAFPDVPFLQGVYRPTFVALHLLWDSFLHERDLAVPVGEAEPPTVELAATGLYGSLFAGLAMGPFPTPTIIDFALAEPAFDDPLRSGRWRLVCATDVALGAVPGDGPAPDHVVHAPLRAALDAFTGRGALGGVVATDDVLLGRLGALPARMAPDAA